MKKGLLILIPIIFAATYMSRPVALPVEGEFQTPPLEEQTPAEEVVEELSISITPDRVIQGEPLLITINGLAGSTSTIRAFKFHNSPLSPYVEGGKVKALIGLDLRMPPATYPITLTLTDGRVVQQNVVVRERVIATKPLGIPEKLGGNTRESEKELVNTLVEEGKIINAVPSVDRKLWNGLFRYPLEGEITVTDTYGYSRQTGTGATTLSHKGTDFRATPGTPVYAMNGGLVAYTGFLRNYGHTVILDHGLGLQTIYMHLSEVSAPKGKLVKKGELIAKSGDTGYVLGPHLHLTVKIGKISIDPEKFLVILGER